MIKILTITLTAINLLGLIAYYFHHIEKDEYNANIFFISWFTFIALLIFYFFIAIPCQNSYSITWIGLSLILWSFVIAREYNKFKNREKHKMNPTLRKVLIIFVVIFIVISLFIS